jgi:hypothetical protein
MTLVLSSGAPILQLGDVIAEHRHAGPLLIATPRVLAPCGALADDFSDKRTPTGPGQTCPVLASTAVAPAPRLRRSCSAARSPFF